MGCIDNVEGNSVRPFCDNIGHCHLFLPFSAQSPGRGRGTLYGSIREREKDGCLPPGSDARTWRPILKPCLTIHPRPIFSCGQRRGRPLQHSPPGTTRPASLSGSVTRSPPPPRSKPSSSSPVNTLCTRARLWLQRVLLGSSGHTFDKGPWSAAFLRLPCLHFLGRWIPVLAAVFN